MAGLTRSGSSMTLLSGTGLALGAEVDPVAWLARRGRIAVAATLNPPPGRPPPAWPHPPAHLRLDVEGLPVHILAGPSTLPHEPDDDEVAALGLLVDHLIEQDRPDVLLAPSRTLAAELHESTGRPCLVLPDFLDPATLRADAGDHHYLAYFDLEPASGLAAFARIAHELGRFRPDIPLLVVAGPEGRTALDTCGLDLKRHGTVDLMRPPVDPKKAWDRVRAVLLPDLDGTGPLDAARAALANGLPIITSDRGALPETLGDAGTQLPLPDRLTAATTLLPTGDEVAPWVDAVIRLWDDPDHYADQCRKAEAEARTWAVDEQIAQYRAIFEDLRPRAAVEPLPPGRSKSVVLGPPPQRHRARMRGRPGPTGARRRPPEARPPLPTRF